MYVWLFKNNEILLNKISCWFLLTTKPFTRWKSLPHCLIVRKKVFFFWKINAQMHLWPIRANIESMNGMTLLIFYNHHSISLYLSLSLSLTHPKSQFYTHPLTLFFSISINFISPSLFSSLSPSPFFSLFYPIALGVSLSSFLTVFLYVSPSPFISPRVSLFLFFSLFSSLFILFLNYY